MSALRPTLLDINAKDLAVLESHFTPGWTEVLRDFAISQWITLFSRQKVTQMEPGVMAELAVELAIGIAKDLGGSQPYIPIGASIQIEQRKAKVLRMLAAGAGYDETARACGLTKSRVRQIERQERQKNKKARNAAIPGWREEAQRHTDAVASSSANNTQTVRCTSA